MRQGSVLQSGFVLSKLVSLACGVVLVGLLLASPTLAALVHVQPSDSLAAALDQVQSGDTLLLHAGIYVQQLNLAEGRYPHLSGTAQRRTTIAAAPGEVVILRPGHANTVLRIAGTKAVPYRYLTFDGLHLDATGGGYGVSISGAYAESIRLHNGEVFGGAKSGISGMGADGEVIGMRIHHNGDSRLSHGMYVCPLRGRIQGNDIYANSGYGIQVYDGHTGLCANDTVIVGNHVHDNLGDGGVVLGSGARLFFCGNTVERNHGGGVRPICYGGATQVQVKGNTIVDNLGIGVAICAGVTGTQVRDNLLRGNQGEVQDLGTGSVVVGNGQKARGAAGAVCGGAVPAGPVAAPGPDTLPQPTNLRLLIVP